MENIYFLSNELFSRKFITPLTTPMDNILNRRIKRFSGRLQGNTASNVLFRQNHRQNIYARRDALFRLHWYAIKWLMHPWKRRHTNRTERNPYYCNLSSKTIERMEPTLILQSNKIKVSNWMLEINCILLWNKHGRDWNIKYMRCVTSHNIILTFLCICLQLNSHLLPIEMQYIQQCK